MLLLSLMCLQGAQKAIYKYIKQSVVFSVGAVNMLKTSLKP